MIVQCTIDIRPCPFDVPVVVQSWSHGEIKRLAEVVSIHFEFQIKVLRDILGDGEKPKKHTGPQKNEVVDL